MQKKTRRRGEWGGGECLREQWGEGKEKFSQTKAKEASIKKGGDKKNQKGGGDDYSMMRWRGNQNPRYQANRKIGGGEMSF